jgi:DNA-3-methyladenine glycosylase
MSTRPGPRADPAALPAGAAGPLLPREFFARPALAVAGELLGCVLAHDTSAGLVAVVLTEVEAYEGAADPASHAYRGQTVRNAVMFGAPGHAYVYFTYGMHFCVNLVCLPPGTASAVLLRAGRVIEGVPLAAARRSAGRNGTQPGRAVERELARGPARLCQALGIGRELDGADVCDPGSPLRILAGPDGPADPRAASPAAGSGPVAGSSPAAGSGPVAGSSPAPGAGPGWPRVSTGPRVGISAAADRPWRFWLTGDPTVSSYRPHTPRPRKHTPPARK